MANYYILNLYGNNIKISIDNNTPYIVDAEFIKRYRSIHKSMMLEYLASIDEDFIYKRIGEDIYSLSLINVIFNDNQKRWNEQEQKYKGNFKGARNYLYKHGFTVNGIHYVEFQRSSSKARNGNNLFIREDLLNPMLQWYRIGIDIENVLCDVAAFRAYESLTSSDINGKVKILPENILLVNDVKGYCKVKQSITTRDENNNFTVNECSSVVENDIFDGESLLDERKFTGVYKGKGFILLRNHFIKTAAFNTKLQKYFQDNNITKLVDMFGVEHDAKDIMMITTPNSIKLFKFKDLVADGTRKGCWDYLMQHIEPKWGICKTEHRSKFTKDFSGTQQLSYQFINSMPLSKKEIEKIAKLEIDYTNLLKRDFEAFREYAGLKNTSEHRFVLRMVEINPAFQGTQYFKDFYNSQMKYRKESLQQGKIRIKNSDNMIFLGNPLELLRWACKQELRNGNVHTGYQVYTKKYKSGEYVAMFRSPHLAAGNIVYAKNVWLDEFRYFNLTKNIIIINSYDSDIYNRLQGADLDSDFAFVTNNSIIVDKAKECQRWLTPVNGVPADKRLRKFNAKEKSVVDKKISCNTIGIICNTGQILNSWLWHFESKGEHEKAKQIYSLISELSSLSQLEIDKAKKLVNINMRKEIGVITEKARNIGIPIVELDYNKKQIVQPMFFKVKAQISNSHNKDKFKKNTLIIPEAYQELNCSMDLLQQVLKEKVETKKEIRTIPIEDILSVQKMAHKDNKTVLQIEEIARQTQAEISSLWKIFESSPTDYYKERNKQEQIIVEQLSNMDITPQIIARIIYDIYSQKRNYKLMGWLWDAKTDVFEECIKEMKKIPTKSLKVKRQRKVV